MITHDPQEGTTTWPFLWGALRFVESWTVTERDLGGGPLRYTYAVKVVVAWVVGLHVIHDTTQADHFEVGVQLLGFEFSFIIGLWPSLP